MTTNPMPKAKTERLIVREIDGETLVYDRGRDAASCLNEFAARVWRECDGETSVAAITATLGEDERAVWLALHQLTKAQLLTEAIAFPPDMSAAKSRREIAGLGVGRGSVRHQHRRADASTSSKLWQARRPLHGGTGNWHVLWWARARVRRWCLCPLNGELLRMARAQGGAIAPVRWNQVCCRAQGGASPTGREPHPRKKSRPPPVSDTASAPDRSVLREQPRR
jgi:hypothetical protein